MLQHQIRITDTKFLAEIAKDTYAKILRYFTEEQRIRFIDEVGSVRMTAQEKEFVNRKRFAPIAAAWKVATEVHPRVWS